MPLTSLSFRPFRPDRHDRHIFLLAAAVCSCSSGPFLGGVQRLSTRIVQRQLLQDEAGSGFGDLQLITSYLSVARDTCRL